MTTHAPASVTHPLPAVHRRVNRIVRYTLIGALVIVWSQATHLWIALPAVALCTALAAYATQPVRPRP